MIFGEGFDKSLLLILISDINNRKQIINLIKSIPLELIDRIRKEVNCFTEGNLNQFVRDNNGNNFMYRVTVSDSNLRIKLSKWKNHDYDKEEIYDLDLGKINLGMIPDDDIIYIGSFFYSYNEQLLGIGPMYVNSDGVGYELYKNLEDKLVVQISSNRVYDKKINIDINSIKFGYDDLNNKNIKNLVRRK